MPLLIKLALSLTQAFGPLLCMKMLRMLVLEAGNVALKAAEAHASKTDTQVDDEAVAGLRRIQQAAAQLLDGDDSK